jgi:hypothetical protein
MITGTTELWLRCDTCGRGLLTNATATDAAAVDAMRAIAADYGWLMRVSGQRITDLCPACARAGERAGWPTAVVRP